MFRVVPVHVRVLPRRPPPAELVLAVLEHVVDGGGERPGPRRLLLQRAQGGGRGRGARHGGRRHPPPLPDELGGGRLGRLVPLGLLGAQLGLARPLDGVRYAALPERAMGTLAPLLHGGHLGGGKDRGSEDVGGDE